MSSRRPAPRESYITERYQVRKRQGKGEFAEVFHVRDRHLGRDLALKRFRLRAGADLMRMLADEFVLLARLEHPVLPKVHDFAVDDDGRPFFTMDLIAGSSLRDLLDHPVICKEGAVALVGFAERVLSALSYIHSRGIVHGDVKPSNLLFPTGVKAPPDWRHVRLVDFGLSGTIGKLVGGTPRYMAPEVQRGAAPDPQSDLYSLGLVLDECLGEHMRAKPGDERFAARFSAIVARLATASRGLRYRRAEEAYGDLLGLLESYDRRTASRLRRSFTFAIRPRVWEPSVEAVIERLSECRTGRGGSIVLTGLRGEPGERVINDVRAQSLALGMSVVRVAVERTSDDAPLRIALGREADRLIEETNGTGPGDSSGNVAHGTHSSGLAARIAAASKRMGATGAVWILANTASIAEGDWRALGHLSLALRRHSALVILPLSAEVPGRTVDGADPRDLFAFPSLDRDGIEKCLTEVFGEIQPRAGLAKVLHELVGGDVEGLDRSLTLLVRSNTLKRKEGGWIADLSATRRIVHRQRSSDLTLPPLAPRDLIQARTIGILGPRFGEQEAAGLTGLRPAALKKTLAELRSVGLLREVTDHASSREWAFFPLGIAERLAEGLKPGVRRSLHLRALRGLRETSENGFQSATARHLEGAGRNLEAARAYLRLGTSLISRHEHIEAQWSLEQALRLVPPEETALRGEAHYHLAAALKGSGHFDGCRLHLDHLLSHPETIPSGVGLPEMLLEAGRCLLELGLHEDAMERFQGALEQASRGEPDLRARILRALGWVHYLGGSLKDAENHRAAAMELSGAGISPMTLASIHSLYGHIARSSGLEDEAEAGFQRALAICRAEGNEFGIAGELQNLGVNCIRRDPQRARDFFYAAEKEFSRLSDESSLASTRMNLAIAEKALGDWDAAERCYRASIDIGEQCPHRGLYRSYMNLGTLLTDRGEFEEATACLERALRLASGLSGRLPALFVELNRARLLLRKGFPDKALAHLESISGGLSIAHPTTWMNLHSYLAQSLAELGRFEEATRAARVSCETAAEFSEETNRGEALLYSGAVDRLAGRTEPARQKLEKARAIFLKHGQAHYAARAELEMAEVLSSDPAAVREALESASAAASVFEKLEARPFLVRAQRVRDHLSSVIRRSSEAPRELQTLYRIADICRDTADLPSLLEGILDACISLLGARRGMIFLKSEENGELVRAASRWLSADEEEDVLRTSRGIIQRTMSGDPTLLSRDAMQDSRLRSLKSVIRFEIRSVICTALRSGETVLGTIYVDHPEPDRFSEKEAEFMNALAGFAAPAIDAARTRMRLDRQVRGLRHAVRALRAGGAEVPSVDSLVGTSEAIRKVRGLVEKCLGVSTRVLLLGETGTGKDLVAQVIHSSGDRAGMPFVQVGGGELSGELVTSELFGIDQGIATGVKPHAGKFEQADHGTLYFHEIEAIPLDTQARLLRVLEARSVERLGSTTSIPINVRFIAATSADLPTLVRDGRFRQDLLYRLNVFTINLPPLRERREDIAPLLQHFVRILSNEHAAPAPGLPASVLHEYEAHDWPGNVRELRHVVERAVVLRCKEFPPPGALVEPGTEATMIDGMEEALKRKANLEEVCALYVERVYERCNRNKKLACDFLKINYRTLMRYLAMRGH